MQRRSLLKVGVATAMLVGIAAGGLALVQPGLKNGHLTAAGRAVFAAVARAVLDGLLPSDPAASAAAISGHLDRIDVTIAGFPPALRAEVGELVTLLSNAGGRLTLTGLTSAWPDASTTDVQTMLQRLRLSTLALRQQVYHALRDLTNAAYFADPSAWPTIGYPGPTAIPVTPQ